jgi:hypothetical protein
LKECRANIGPDGKKITENFAQFCNRLVGIGNATESAVVFPPGLQPQPIQAGEKVTVVKSKPKRKYVKKTPQPQVQVQVPVLKKYSDLTDEEKTMLANEPSLEKMLDLLIPGTALKEFNAELKILEDKEEALTKEWAKLEAPDTKDSHGFEQAMTFYRAVNKTGATNLDEYTKIRGAYLVDLHKKIKNNPELQREWDSTIQEGEEWLCTSLGLDVGYTDNYGVVSTDTLKQWDDWYRKDYQMDQKLTAIRKEIYVKRDNFYSQIDSQFIDLSVTPTPRREINPKIKDRGLPEGHQLDPVEAKLQSHIDNRVPMMAMSSSNLGELLKKGSFSNAYELSRQGRKVGISDELGDREYKDYLKRRKEIEHRKLGIPLEAKPSERPIYGVISNNAELASLLPMDDDSGLRAYGDMVVKFKPEVKDDVTVTVDDSMSSMSNNIASPANAVSKQSIPPRIKINLESQSHQDIYEASEFNVPRYLEWQSGRKLNLADIDSLVIPVNVWAALPQNIKDMVTSNNIKVELIAPRGK